MDENTLLAPLAFVVVALMAGALLKVSLRRVKVPYTVGLFVLGLAVGTLNVKGYLVGLPIISDSLTMACNLDPDMILNLFLPILIFSAAYELDVHIFRRTLVNATLLSVPGIIISMLLTGAMMIGISHIAPAYASWNWVFALMFGALISATDPVAVVALLGELGVSKRFSTLLDGESLLNDGTGIVLFMLLYAPFTSSVAEAHSSPVLSFLIVVGGGIVIGYLLARTFLYYVSRGGVKGDPLLQTSMMILLSYLTFILAQDIFKLSGVIALVAFGLVIAYHGAATLDIKTRHFMKEFWELLSYIANTLIFIIIGVIISEKVDLTWSDVAVLLVVYIGINLIRMLMITALYPLLNRSGYGVSKREGMILTWGALRGALGLTLALMVSYTESIPEPIRRQILLLTAGIVTLTLVVNATTIKWLLRRLGLLEQSASRRLIDAEIRAQLRAQSRRYYEALRADSSMEGADWEQIALQLPQEIEHPNETPDKQELIAGLRLQFITSEREVIASLYHKGVISFSAQRRLIETLDLILDLDGAVPLDKRVETLGLVESNIPVRFKRIKKIFYKYYTTEPISQYEVAYGVYISQRDLTKIIKRLGATQLLNQTQLSYLKGINEEIEKVGAIAEEFMTQFAAEYPEAYKEALTLRAERMLSRFIRETIDSLAIDGQTKDALREELEAEQEDM